MANLFSSCIGIVTEPLFLGGLITGVSILVGSQIAIKFCEQTPYGNVRDSSNRPQKKTTRSEEEGSESDEDWDDVDESDGDNVPDEEIKLMLVVRNDLGMGKGKAAAQCAHAAVGAYRQASLKAKNLVQAWFKYGQAKVVVKVNTEKELLSIATKAKEQGVISCLISDAGRTQIKSGSRTVLAVGPAKVSVLTPLTGHLKLY